jgi:hypothetical protein
MEKQHTKNVPKIIKALLLCYFLAVLLNSCISSYIGYNGYEKWKYRRNTWGDKREAISRGAFIKDLNYESNLVLDSFNIYIEKGYWFGFKSMDETRFQEGTHYPYQISFGGIKGMNVYTLIVNYEKFDSIDNSLYSRPHIYLDKPYLKDTIILTIMKFHKIPDSLGYIKVWDADKE